jgi:hypothetical protein
METGREKCFRWPLDYGWIILQHANNTVLVQQYYSTLHTSAIQSTQASWIGASLLLRPESEACRLCVVTFAFNSTKMGEGISSSHLSIDAASFLSNVFSVVY